MSVRKKDLETKICDFHNFSGAEIINAHEKKYSPWHLNRILQALATIN